MRKANIFYLSILSQLIVIFLFSNISLLSQQLVLSEIMFNPAESNSEFIEIFNTSNEKNINLSNYKIKYHTSSSDEIISINEDYALLPSHFAVIFEADYNFETGIYKDMLPENALIFILDDNAFGSAGMANTSDRKIYLIGSDEDTLDVYTYSANNETGYSDERKEYVDNIWENAKLFNGTPGRKNSVAAVNYDLAISEIYSSKSYVIIGDSITLHIKIMNIGSKDVTGFSLKLSHDQNKDAEIQNEELIFSEEFLDLKAQDSLIISVPFLCSQKGEIDFIALIEFNEDEFIENNKNSFALKCIELNEFRGDLVINEFMYDPKSTEPEWIELYNKSEKVLNLKKYQIADNSDSVTIIKNDIYLNPNDYLILADDSTISNTYQNIENVIIANLPALNNTGDDILLLDSLGRIIDSLSYTSDWGGNNGNSLERIDAFIPSEEINNWKESVFPTPGYINSVTQKDYDLIIDSVFTNPQFPIIDTKAKFIVKVINIGKNQLDFNISLYNDTNQDSLADYELETGNLIKINSGDSVNVVLNYEANVYSAESNYIFKLITKDDDSSNNILVYKLIPSFMHNSIVISEIMYSPINYEPEWIELFNNSDYDININNWTVGDVLTNPIFKTISMENNFLKNSYLLITKSNSIYNFHRSINCQVIELPFANLNNDEDGIVLKDINNRTIDSVKYFNTWGGTAGHSLERINFAFSSTNQNNWNGSSDLEGSTPGRINSITPKDYDLSIKSLSIIPKFPIEGDSIIIFAMIQNYGNIEAKNFKIDFYTGDFDNHQIVESQSNLFLSAGDSILLSTIKMISINDTLTVSAGITFNLDQDILNNYTEKVIIPGFNKNTVLINEIMFKPNKNEPEWIEIINNTDSVIDLSNWLIGDLSSQTIITYEETLLNPQEFLVISDYNSIPYFNSEIKIVYTDLPSLSNTKDAIIIYDFRKAVIDSTYYNVPISFNSGTSLERVELGSASTEISNWTFSLDQNKSTPGRGNSISVLPVNRRNDLIITEIMFDPSDNNSEFLEILNNSNEQIEIGGWKIVDENGEYFNIIENSLIMEPEELFVVAADSSIIQNYNWLMNNKNLSILNLSSLNLTNSGKLIYLKDFRSTIIDSIYYTNSWHNSALLANKNISLELINLNLTRNKSSNWSSSVSEFGATPGLTNSINVENLISEAKLKITPNPFSPDNDGFEDFTFINYNLTQPVSQIRIRVFDSKGRFVRSIANNEPSGSVGTIIFDGLDSRMNPLKIGIYIILFEAVNLNNAVIDVIKDVVVVARKL